MNDDFALQVMSAVADNTRAIGALGEFVADESTLGLASALRAAFEGDFTEAGTMTAFAIIPGPADNAFATAVRLYPGKVGRWEWHHVWPKYLGGAKDGVRVRLPAEYHQLITNAFREAHGYGQGRLSRDQAIQIMRDVYRELGIRGFEVK